MHNNMITINGQKMGKSLGNFITLNEFFTGQNPNLKQAYSPMTIRFFILMAHYRGTVDFSNDALQAAEKAMSRLMEAYNAIGRIQPSAESTVSVSEFKCKCYEAMDDDLNTPIVISHLFDAAKVINQAVDGNAKLTAADVAELKSLFDTFLFDILGIKAEEGGGSGREEAFGKVVDMLLEQRAIAKANKDWATSDKIRNELTALGFEIKDTKDGATWKLNR
jgi:cysteinyl-tRNA synthetase